MSDAADTSVQLLRRYRAGDKHALDELLKRQIQPMRHWARGRLPRWARDAMNTDDIVQDVLVRTVIHLYAFEPQHDGALQATCARRSSCSKPTKRPSRA